MKKTLSALCLCLLLALGAFAQAAETHTFLGIDYGISVDQFLRKMKEYDIGMVRETYETDAGETRIWLHTERVEIYIYGHAVFLEGRFDGEDRLESIAFYPVYEDGPTEIVQTEPVLSGTNIPTEQFLGDMFDWFLSGVTEEYGEPTGGVVMPGSQPLSVLYRGDTMSSKEVSAFIQREGWISAEFYFDNITYSFFAEKDGEVYRYSRCVRFHAEPQR